MDLNRWQIFRKLDPAVSGKVKFAYTWGPGTAAFVIMENDDVYCIGHHDSAILAGKKRVKSLRKIGELCGKGIVDFQCGNNFVMALTEDGKLYEWIEDAKPLLQSDFPEDTEIVEISAGFGHCIALSSCGKVFCWGTNKTGQVGNGTFENQPDPQKVIPALGLEIEHKIITIASGKNSSFAVADGGDVWAWGHKSEIGLKVTAHQSTPVLILEGKNIATIACSSTHTLAISKDFSLYYWRNGGLVELKGVCGNPILDVGSSIHSNLIVYSTTKSLSVLGEWFGKDYDTPTMISYGTMDEVFASCATPTMYRPVKPIRLPLPAALASMEALLNDHASSDVDFVIDGQVIHAHKPYLKKRSPYFAKMFANDWKENSAGAVKIECYSYTAFRSFLCYLYTGKIQNLSCDNMLELLEAANYYQEQSLFRACEELLKLNVTVENACLVYAVAAEQGAEGLKHYVLDFAKLRFREIAFTEGFAALNKKLTTQLIRELIVDRKLAESNDPDTEEEEDVEVPTEQEFRAAA